MTASAPQKPSERERERDRPGGSDDQLRPRKRKDRGPTTEQVLRFLPNSSVRTEISFHQFDSPLSLPISHVRPSNVKSNETMNCVEVSTSDEDEENPSFWGCFVCKAKSSLRGPITRSEKRRRRMREESETVARKRSKVSLAGWRSTHGRTAGNSGLRESWLAGQGGGGRGEGGAEQRLDEISGIIKST